MKKILIPFFLILFLGTSISCKKRKAYKEGKTDGEEYCNCKSTNDSVCLEKIEKIAFEKMYEGDIDWMQGFTEIRNKKCPDE